MEALSHFTMGNTKVIASRMSYPPMGMLTLKPAEVPESVPCEIEPEKVVPPPVL